MPASTHETKIKITADARQAQKTADNLQKGLSKALSSPSVEKFNAQLLAMDKIVKRIVAGNAKIKDPFKTSLQTVKAYNRELSITEKALQRIVDLQGQLGGGTGMGAGAGAAAGGGGGGGGGGGAFRHQPAARHGRRGFVAGLGQGVGLGAFIPTGREMMPRMGGYALGRTIHAVASPFLNPGVGGLATAVQAVPVVGQVLSGAIQQAYGAYGSAVAFSQAQRANLAYMGPTHRAFIKGTMPPWVPPSTALEQEVRRQAPGFAATQYIVGGLAEQVMKTHPGISPIEAVDASQSLMAAGMTDPRGAGGPEHREDLAKYRDKISTGMAHIRAAARTGKPYTDFTNLPPSQQMVITGRSGRKRKRGRDKSKGYWADVGGLPGPGEGVPYGLGPTQMASLFGEYMHARGGDYTDIRQSQFHDVMAAETGYGISGGLAGQFARIGTGTGGGRTGPQGLSGVLAAADAMKMKGSMTEEYLKALVEQGHRAETQGVRFNAPEFVRMTAMLNSAGIAPLQATRIAGGLQQAAMQVGARGEHGGSDMLMLEAAGFTPGGSEEDYAKARRRLQGGLTGKRMSHLIGRVSEGSRTFGYGGPVLESLFFQQYMQGQGTSMSMKTARKLMDMSRGGGLEGKTADEVKGIMDALESPEASKGVRKEAKRKLGTNAGLTVSSAGLESMRVGAGGRVAGMVVGLEKVGLSTISILQNFGDEMQGLIALMQRAIKFGAASTKGGLRGVINRAVGPQWSEGADVFDETTTGEPP